MRKIGAKTSRYRGSSDMAQLMRDPFEPQLRRARDLEIAGDLPAAHAICETVLRAEPGRLYVRSRLSALEQAFGHYRRSREHTLAAAHAVRGGRWNEIGSVASRLLAHAAHRHDAVGAHPGNHSLAATGGELRDFNAALCWETDSFASSSAAPAFVERLQDMDFARIGARYLQRTVSRYAGKRCLVDKNPMNLVYAGHIAKALPQAKILCLRRSADGCLLFQPERTVHEYRLRLQLRPDRANGPLRPLRFVERALAAR